MQGRHILVATLVLFPLFARAERIISEGDNWRFINGVNPPPSGWTTNGFNDTSWFNFPSGFGYGDGDDRTVLSDMTNTVNGYVAFFTRKTFVVNNPAALNYLTLGVDYDDGFVAWINGVEVARRNVTSNTIDNATLAANHEASRGNGGSDPQEKEFITITNNLSTLLVPGNNTIAVSGHNVSKTNSDASLIVEVYTNVTLVRGPFIQLPDSNGVTVVWRTDALTDSAVDYGLDAGYSGGTVSSPALVREHIVQLPSVLEGTNYFYRVRSGGVNLAADVLRTRRLSGQSFRFAVIGDFGQENPGLSNIANQVNAANVDLFLTVGDNIYFDGQPGLYDPYWFSLYAPTMRRAPCMPVLGNHDVVSANGHWMTDFFVLPTNGPASSVERNYSYDYGNVHFAVVDSNAFTTQATTTAAIKTWLSNDLAQASKPWKLVYFHHPPYTSDGNGVHSDDEGVKTNLMPIIEAAGVDAVFVGHNHFYERINAINGVYHIITGGSGAPPETATNIKTYSNVRIFDVNSFALLEIEGLRLKLLGVTTNGTVRDEFHLDKEFFRMDGLLDTGASNAWLRAQNGLRLYAAIRGPYLYVATQDAGETSDHFIYLNNILSTNRPANWAKAGTVMQWDSFLADENDGGYVSWFDSTGASKTNFPQYQAMTSGLNNNGTFANGVLEGVIDVVDRFTGMPPQIYLAAAPFQTTNGGALVFSALVSNVNGNANIESNEFVRLNTRDIALDLPVANAGGNFSAEAGMSASLNGSTSSAPSGLPLSYNWTQASGESVTILNSNSAIASFTATNADARVFNLAVNDTRFTSNATVTVTVTAFVDTDGDGLSDAEETTGQDNILTAANPGGNTSNPLLADTDGDGASDGDEAIAGTNPNSSTSVFRVSNAGMNTGGFLLEWAPILGKTNCVDYRNDLTNNWSGLTNLFGVTPVTNVLDTSAAGQPKRFYRIRLAP